MMSIEMIIIGILLLLLSVIAVAVIIQKNLYYSVILMAIMSVIAGVLFVIFNAPDIALAEIAVGSALIPFVYIIAITKQREFLILDEVMDSNSQDIIRGVQKFCKEENLKLKIMYKGYEQDYELRDVFRKNNVDMIINKSSTSYEIICKESSALDERALEHITNMKLDESIIYVRIGENVKED